MASPGQPRLPQAAARIEPRSRVPAVPVVVAVAAGITLDRLLGPSQLVWLVAGASGIILWLAVRRPRLGFAAVVALSAACLCLGGAWHHQAWWMNDPDDVSRFASERKRPVRVRGTLTEPPWIMPKETPSGVVPWQPTDRTIATLECRSLMSNSGPVATAGRVRLVVRGELTELHCGDELDIDGSLVLPHPPHNVGDFDYRDWLRTQGIHAILQADHPDAVRRIASANGWSMVFAQARSRFREACRRLLHDHLSEDTRPVAEALLIGSRDRLDEEIRMAFVASGTMHLLAISGLHVGILSAFLWLCCRLLRLPQTMTVVCILSCIVAYAYLTESRPPVIRAAVLAVIIGAGLACHRPVSAANSLAVSALVVLAINPTDLFNLGAQLSFLAVIGILWAARLRRQPDQSERDDLPVEHSWVTARLLAAARWTRDACLVSLIISLLTTPLIAAQFHVASPIGVLANVLLVPFSFPVTWLGYAFLLGGLLMPPLATVFAMPFELGLRMLLAAVKWSAQIEHGHLSVSGPSGWWLIGFYLVLAALIASRRRSWLRYCALRGALIWTIVGLAAPLSAADNRPLRCTFLSVGHGGAILLELPRGETLLYDAGAMNDPDRVRRTIEAALWQAGRTGIDALLVSHADADHFNAAPGLMKSVSIGHLLTARSFLDFQQPGVVQVVETAAAEGVPIRLIRRADRLRLDDATTLSILHPRDGPARGADNAESLILLIEYAGRRILLTGDLERDGLSELLAQPRVPCDVLLAPHHGGRTANTPQLAAWANPRWVVACTERSDVTARLQSIYGPEAEVLNTAEYGAITFEIDADGTPRCLPFRD